MRSTTLHGYWINDRGMCCKGDVIDKTETEFVVEHDSGVVGKHEVERIPRSRFFHSLAAAEDDAVRRGVKLAYTPLPRRYRLRLWCA
jgi:hypothetical protein